MSTEREIDLVRQKLNNDKIKLWLGPFTQPGCEKGIYPDEMLNSFGQSFQMSKSAVESVLEQLRLHALQKLASRTPANVNVTLKLVGQASKATKVVTFSLDIDFSKCNTGKELRTKVAKSLALDHNTAKTSVKIIHKGKLITDITVLTECGFKTGATLLVMRSDLSAFERGEAHTIGLQQTRDDADLLSTVDANDPGSFHYLQVADQDGRVIELPAAERKALGVALALHEKGRTAFKSKKYDTALVFFLEADIEFKQCTSELLKSVDNYALLNLDIVWCYLCLNSISDLPDAEQRLCICEECFNRSYGPGLERLKALKGSFGQEAALLARLHLLQAITLYHTGQIIEAKIQLERVAAEFKTLRVDDDKLAEVISFGYTTAEARLALRSCYGNVESAVYQILKKREEKMILRRQESQKRKRLSEQQKLGKTVNGEWVQTTFYNQIISMGFSPEKAKQSLKMSNNNISMAIQFLHDQGAALKSIDQEKIAQLVSMGFEQNAVEEALTNCGGDLSKAQEILVTLLALDPILPQETTASNNNAGCLKDAVARLTEDIGEDENDYLDLNMEEEESFLHEYIALLQ